MSARRKHGEAAVGHANRAASDSDSSAHTPQRRITRKAMAAATEARHNDSSSEPSDVEDDAAAHAATAANELATGRRLSRGAAASATEHVEPSADDARVAAASASASGSSPSSALALSREVRALTFVHRGYGLDEATIRANAIAAQQQAEADVIARRQARHAKRRRALNGTVGRKRTARGGTERDNNREEGATEDRSQQQSKSSSDDDDDAAMHASDDSSHSERDEEVVHAAAASAASSSSDESVAPSIPVGSTPKARRRSAASARARERAAAASPVSTRGMRFLHRQPLRRARSRRSGQYTRDHSKAPQPHTSSSDSEAGEGDKKQAAEESEVPSAAATAAASSAAKEHKPSPARRTRSHAADAEGASDPDRAAAAAEEHGPSSSTSGDEDDGGAGHAARPLRAAALKSLSAVSKQLAVMNPTRKRRSSSSQVSPSKDASPSARRNRADHTMQIDEEEKQSGSNSSSGSEEEQEAIAAPSTRSRNRRSATAATSSVAPAAAAAPDADGAENDEDAEESEEDEESAADEDRSNDEDEDAPARAASASATASTAALRRKRGAKRRRIVLHPRKKSSAARSGGLASGTSGLAGLDEVEALLRTRARHAEAPAAAAATATEFLPASAGAAARPFSFNAPAVAEGSGSGAAAAAASSSSSSLPAAPRYKCVNRIREGHGLPLYFVAFNTLDARHKDIFASAGTNRITVYRALPSGAVDPLQLYVDEDAHENYYTLAYSIDLKTGAALLLVAGENAVIRVIDLHSRKVARRIVGHGGAINELKIHPLDLSLLASASKDMSVRLWNLQSGACVAILAGEGGHKDEVLSVDFATDGNRIVSAGTDHQIMIWDLSSAAMKNKMKQSFGVGVGVGGGEGTAAAPFAPLLLSSPLFSCNTVHSNYVDHARFLGGFILSKSTEARITLWTTRQRARSRVW